jgi:hypothetical protein
VGCHAGPVDWGKLLSENAGSIIGVAGTLLGLVAGAAIEGLRQRRSRGEASAVRSEERRVRAHEQMLAQMSALLAQMTSILGFIHYPSATDERVRASIAAFDFDAVLPVLDKVIESQGLVALHSPSTRDACNAMVTEIISFGALATGAAAGDTEIAELRAASARVLAAHALYATAAERDVSS